MRLLAPTLFALSLLTAACASEPDQKEGRFGGVDAPARKADDVVSTPTQPKKGDELTPNGPKATAPEGPSQEKSATATTCQTPRDLGAIAGDADAPQRTERGTCSEWLRIRVTESNAGVWVAPMKLNLTLSSPPGADFDLHVYVNKDTDVLECTKEEVKSELPANRSDVAQVTWGESWSGNNTDDQRPVSIEVRAKDPASCGKGEWVLILEGNR
jgi:hypothetical protein